MSEPEGTAMNEGRRESDHRFHDIESKLDTLDEKMVEVYDKITNGLTTSVALTEQKVNLIDEKNTEDHKEVKSDLKDLGKKLDKLLWALVSISFLAVIGSIVKFAIERVA